MQAFVTKVKLDSKITDPRAYLGGVQTGPGLDLKSLKKACIRPGEMKEIPTGLSVQLPKGFIAKVECAASVGRLVVLVLVEVFDYRGGNPLSLCLHNWSNKALTMHAGQVVAHLVIQPAVYSIFEVVTELESVANVTLHDNRYEEYMAAME